jgi:hypothetical protein
LDVDYRAVCRHAAGIFLRQGHRHLALVVPDFGTAGDLASEESFKQAIEQHNDSARASVIRHNGTARSISSKLDALFESTQPPTALLVARTPYVFAVIMHLLNRGLGVPDPVSLRLQERRLRSPAVPPDAADAQRAAVTETHSHRPQVRRRPNRTAGAGGHRLSLSRKDPEGHRERREASRSSKAEGGSLCRTLEPNLRSARGFQRIGTGRPGSSERNDLPSFPTSPAFLFRSVPPRDDLRASSRP